MHRLTSQLNAMLVQVSKRSQDHLVGRTDTNKRVVFRPTVVPNKNHTNDGSSNSIRVPEVGDYVEVNIIDTGITLQGEAQAITSLARFASEYQSC
jgi:hypothetical protein